MPMSRGFRTLLCLALVSFAAALVGCQEAPVLLPGDQAATHGGVEFRVGNYSIQYLELSDESGETFEYPNPVLVVPVTMINRGEDAFDYRPTHSIQQMSEATTPLIFYGPSSPEADWRENQRRPITAVYLERGRLADQLHQTTTLAPGEELTDLFLFELPDPSQNKLIMSIPPTMHRASLPLFLEINYREPQPTGPQMHAVGNSIEFDGVIFTVTAVEQTYIQLTDSNQGKGFSTEPVLKVSYTVSNETEDTVTFDPAHRDLSGRQGAILHSLHTEFNRARFPATTTLEGQQGRVQIEPGKSVEDFAIFERPTEKVEGATFELAASHFQRSGRVRVNFDFAPEDVEQPEEMKASN